MTESTTQKLSCVNRCAVCKVDLKGKFVYIDDEVEKLFAYPKEELFGKELVEYLDDNSRDIIENILNQRNNYETFFDSTTITIIKKDGSRADLNVICTLNFIAGNPVNFQIIFDPSHSFVTSDSSRNSNPSNVSEQEIVEIDHDVLFDYGKLIEALYSVSQATNAVLYAVDDTKFEIVAVTSEDEADDSVLEKLTLISSLHVDFAKDEDTYSLLDEQTVRNAVEKYNESPNEYFLPIQIDTDSKYYLRFLYPDSYNHEEVEKAHTQLGYMIEKIEDAFAFKKYVTQNESSVVDIKFTVGFLDTIEVPAFLTDSEGEVIGYNPEASKYFAKSHLNGSYMNIIKSIVSKNKDLSLDDIIDYINSSIYELESDVKKFRVKVTSKALFKMTIIKIGDNETDRSACFVFVPLPNSE
ncbi:MAG: PAS domain-containing protein [Calditrichaeota bacterium]|nr:MAG: PAS domain-containing protein [Calditrichota bacterium]